MIRSVLGFGPMKWVGLAMCVCLVPAYAEAAGLNATEHGVRGLGRGGAFVAGADDLGAITYNPAGIFGAGSQFFVDATVGIFGSSYTRQALLRQVDPNTGETIATFEQTFPTVEGSATPLPIPTLAGSVMPHPDWVVALAVTAPSAVLASYPDVVANQPAPQRYQLLSLDGSLLLNIGGYVAWRPVEQLQIGVGLEVLVGAFNSRQVLSGCLPERFFCAPEDPEWDLVAEIGAAPIITPTGNVGAIWEFYDGWRLGASFHLPYYIIAPASLETRLPSAAPYRNAEQEGKDATMEFQLPWEIRLGIEARDMVKGLRIEVAADYEHWAMHDQISVTPENVAVTNLPGFPEKYYLPEITIPRNCQSTIQGMIGAEYEIPASQTVDVTPRLGFSYETSATPVEHTSVLTLDSGKATLSGGASISVGDARFDLVYAHQFIQAVTVSPETARLPQTVPVSANPPAEPNYINGGIYEWHMDVVGLGFSYTFEHPKQKHAADEEGEAPPVKPAPKPPPTEALPSEAEEDAG